MKLPEGLDPRVVQMVAEALEIVSHMLAKEEISLQGGLERVFELGYECGRIRGIDDMQEIVDKLRSPS